MKWFVKIRYTVSLIFLGSFLQGIFFLKLSEGASPRWCDGSLRDLTQVQTQRLREYFLDAQDTVEFLHEIGIPSETVSTEKLEALAQSESSGSRSLSFFKHIGGTDESPEDIIHQIRVDVVSGASRGHQMFRVQYFLAQRKIRKSRSQPPSFAVHPRNQNPESEEVFPGPIRDRLNSPLSSTARLVPRSVSTAQEYLFGIKRGIDFLKLGHGEPPNLSELPELINRSALPVIIFNGVSNEFIVRWSRRWRHLAHVVVVQSTVMGTPALRALLITSLGFRGSYEAGKTLVFVPSKNRAGARYHEIVSTNVRNPEEQALLDVLRSPDVLDSLGQRYIADTVIPEPEVTPEIRAVLPPSVDVAVSPSLSRFEVPQAPLQELSPSIDRQLHEANTRIRALEWELTRLVSETERLKNELRDRDRTIKRRDGERLRFTQRSAELEELQRKLDEVLQNAESAILRASEAEQRAAESERHRLATERAFDELHDSTDGLALVLTKLRELAALLNVDSSLETENTSEAGSDLDPNRAIHQLTERLVTCFRMMEFELQHTQSALDDLSQRDAIWAESRQDTSVVSPDEVSRTLALAYGQSRPPEVSAEEVFRVAHGLRPQVIFLPDSIQSLMDFLKTESSMKVQSSLAKAILSLPLFLLPILTEGEWLHQLEKEFKNRSGFDLVMGDSVQQVNDQIVRRERELIFEDQKYLALPHIRARSNSGREFRIYFVVIGRGPGTRIIVRHVGAHLTTSGTAHRSH